MFGKSRTLRSLLLGPLLLGLAACGGDDPGSQTTSPSGQGDTVAKIEGEIFYRERMMLPPGAEVEVQLQDISRPDALASVMTSVLIRPEGGPPYPFAIEYDPATIDTRMRYALRATISVGERLLFTTTEYIDPFSGNPLQVLVQRVAEPVEKAPEPEADPDPAPVSPTTPAAGETGGKEPANQPAWLLQTLGGEPAPLGADGAPVDLSLNQNDSTATGFSGCNRYSGKFSSGGRSNHGTPIKFGPLASTMRACADGGDLEQQYLQMLGSVDAYRIEASTLELLQGDRVVATFRLR